MRHVGLTTLELEELREEALKKYDHPTKPTPMLLNPRGVLALIARGDALQLEVARLKDYLRLEMFWRMCANASRASDVERRRAAPDAASVR